MHFFKNTCFLIAFSLLVATAGTAKSVQMADSAAAVSISYIFSPTNARVRIDIFKDKREIKLVYNIQASLFFLRDTTASNPIFKKGVFLESHYFGRRYRGLLSDTVETNDAALKKIVDQVLSSSNEELERPARAKNAVAIDGTSFTFDIATGNGGKRTVYARSPGADIQTVLYELLTRVSVIYYKSNTNGYLKGQTAGY
ncbi:hypothetical protein ACFQZS_10990 [Mucilaginibacter calamicampi]|uniref:DUF4390 domain-containing protein n=1 Tax=Mucilaginibacter calamicampi TaxID=1302352 RepID=A0ABW2YZ20_9SPHI